MKIMNEIDKITYKEDGGAKRRQMEAERKDKKDFNLLWTCRT